MKLWHTSGLKTLRQAAELTNDWVASNPVVCKGFGQASLLVDLALGSLTEARLKIQFSPDGENWYDETDDNTAGHSAIEHVFTASGRYRLLVKLADQYIRVQAMGVGTTTGSSLAVYATFRVEA